ncbi:MAG: DUF4238 domain-containing protein [Rhodoferax sp.]|uniref:DUF4238 domain-containing protein n=1 Tax=Rhodoferax sp. TaxID=50421 RepID=UPI0013FF8090|nr:DUF4238 domain-containing protein [Rhodoferax sp.]NDP37539.1 DUF4238 domain-containing protein [Rhodoferax sp.]
MAKSVARKHHYVPQAYLAAFTTTGRKDGQFFVLDVESSRAFRTSPGNVAAERDFNRVDIEGHSPDAVENGLAPFEGNAIDAIRRVVETQSFPSDSDWNLILNLLALLAVRNPRLRGSFNRSREQTFRIIADLLASDKKLWDRHMQKAKDAGEQYPNVSFQEFKSFVERGNYNFVFHPEGNLRTEFNALDKILPILGQRIWSVLVAPPEGPEFICADHPVTLVWKGDREGHVGYGLRETEVFFPLGRRVGFYGVYETPLKPVVTCRPLNVAIMNQRLVNSAERQVYSAVESFAVWHRGSIREVRCEG